MSDEKERAFPPSAALTEQQLLENEVRVQRLADLLAGGQALALVGAGCSVSAGFPTWKQLLDKLAAVAEGLSGGFLARPVADDLLEHAQAIRDSIVSAGGQERFDTELGRIFVRTPTLTPMHEDLVKLPFRGFITTNYDGTLEAALENGSGGPRPKPVPVWNGDPRYLDLVIRTLTEKPCRDYIIHLHGVCSDVLGEAYPRTIILTRKDYEEAYGITLPTSTTHVSDGNPHRLREVLSTLLSTRRLVFIGFSLEDAFVNHVLFRSANLSWGWSEPAHFAILPTSIETAAGDQDKARRLRNDLLVESIFYEAKGSDHSELALLVRRLADRFGEAILGPPSESSSLPPLPPPSPPRPAWVQSVNQAYRKKHDTGG